jgi:predicted nucleic acid-binding Zn ribbon protein
MKTDAETFRNEGIRTPTEDTQPHPAGNTAACSLDYSELLGIMKQMQKSTTAQAALVHAQSERIKNKLSELITKLDEVTQVMEEQQFELTCRTKVNGTTESDSDKNLEPTISGEPTTINVTKQIGQEHATLTRFTGSQGNNTSGENATKHTNSEKIDSAHETVTQYTFGLSQLKAYGAMHNGEIVGEQKLADDNAQETSENAEEPANYGQRRSRANEMANYWIGIVFVFWCLIPCYLCVALYMGPEYATDSVMDGVNGIWAGAKHILGTLTNVLFNNMQCLSVSSMIIVILMFNNNALQDQHEGAWNDGQKNGNSTITGVSEDTYAA